MRIAIILYCLLSAIINVSAAENVTPGKYLCVVSDAVGLLTNASTHQRYGGAIALPPERQKFFITIEEAKPLVSDQNYCFGDDAIEALKALRRGQPENTPGSHTFSSLDNYFQVCQARYVLKFSGELSKIETDKYSDNTNLFHDRFTSFWITIDQNFCGILTTPQEITTWPKACVKKLTDLACANSWIASYRCQLRRGSVA